MTLKLTAELADSIAAAIRSLPPGDAVTWARVVSVSRDLGTQLTRQTLCVNETVLAAYDMARSGRLSAREGERESSPESARIERLQRDLAALRSTVASYDLRLVKIVSLARAKGLDLGELA